MNRFTITLLFLCLSPLYAQDSAARAAIDRAFELAGVRGMLESLPSRVNDLTVIAWSQFPQERRRQFDPAIREFIAKPYASEALYAKLRAYFLNHYDDSRMAAFLLLQPTSVYRTLRRLEEAAETPAAHAARRRFEANLKTDPPPPRRAEILRRFDNAAGSTAGQVRIASAIVTSIIEGTGVTPPSDLDAQTTALTAKITPLIADRVLFRNLYVFRNSDDAELEDYVAAVEQPAVQWFNRNLQSALAAAVAERARGAGEAAKTKVSPGGFN